MANLKSLVDVEEIKKENQNAAQEPVISELLKIKTNDYRKINIRVPSDVFDKFEAVNKKRGSSLTGTVNMLINRYIEDHKDLL